MKRAFFPILLCVGTGLGAAGCDRLLKERKRVENLLASVQSAPASSTAVPSPSPLPTAPQTVGGAISDDQIPTPEDFERRAASEITPEKMQAELDRLKKDIGP